MITITVFLKSKNIGVDIGVNPKQKIQDTLEILNGKGFRVELDGGYVTLERTLEQVNVRCDYQQAKVYNGDKIVIA